MSKLNYGCVEVEIGDKTYTLKPTIDAYDKIEGRFGPIIQMLETRSFTSRDAMCFVIAMGAGIGARGASDIKQDMFASGTLNLLPKVTEYLMLLLNPTGKELADEPEESTEGE